MNSVILKVSDAFYSIKSQYFSPSKQNIKQDQLEQLERLHSEIPMLPHDYPH